MSNLGFIVNDLPWPVQFWYNVGLEALVALLCILFLDETGWTRPGSDVYPLLPAGFVQRKLATYAFTKRLTPQRSAREIGRSAVLPFLIGACPATMLVGVSMMIYFSWSVAVTTFLSVFLQEPLEAGGYAFSPKRNAACQSLFQSPASRTISCLLIAVTFTQWVSIFAAQTYGYFANDRLPLYICKRNGGLWKPEYRLHALGFPIFVCYPIGLGIFGACLHHHWHYMVLAFATFVITFSAVAGVGPGINYVVEAFTPALANEVSAVMNLYRLVFGIGITFYLFDWAKVVGINWVFGMMAFFTILAFGLIIVVMIWGESIRKLSFVNIQCEDKMNVVESHQEKDRVNLSSCEKDDCKSGCPKLHLFDYLLRSIATIDSQSYRQGSNSYSCSVCCFPT